MPEPVEAWWSHRQWSKGLEVPYSIGQFRADWERYPVLVRQYHADLNHGISLSQVPPAAEVYLIWQCETGHMFVATPWEQRMRPGRSRRRSTWCPECAATAVRRRPPGLSGRVRPDPRERSSVASAEPAAPSVSTAEPAAPAYRGATVTAPRLRSAPPAPVLCGRSDAAGRSPGDPFASPCAPARASAAEGDLHHRLAQRLEFGAGCTAVRVARPFFDHLEVWPDIVLPELRVAIEYDTTGRDGLEHVGRREAVDRRKDRALRATGWEVVRVRCGRLQPLGPHDVVASGVSAKVVDRVLDELRAIRGDLIVDCYVR